MDNEFNEVPSFDLNNLLTDDVEEINNEDDFNGEDLFRTEDPLDNLNENEEEEEGMDNLSSEIEQKTNHKVAEEEKNDPSEKVGNNTEEKESTKSTANNGSSPNIYSSIAKMLQEEGTFPDLSNDDLEGIEDTSTFIEAIKKQIKSSLDEEYQRIDSALNTGVTPNEINSYRETIQYLNSLNEDTIKNEENEELRKRLILQDLCNRGYSQERAERAYQKSLDKGEDVEDAIEALQANKEFFESKYNDLLENAKKEEAAQIEANKKHIKEFKQSIMEDKKLYGDLDVSKSMREEIYDSLTRPIYTDKKTNISYTAVQKWQLDDPDGFAKALGLMYKLTNGGKEFNKLISQEAKKKVSKARDEFENALKGATYTQGGKLRLANSHNTDNESFLKGWELDV